MAMDPIFDKLINVIQNQQTIIESISQKLKKIESIGGGGSASIEDYATGKKYARNTLLVDTATETVYRVLGEYTSIDIKTDASNGNLKLVGFESQVVSMDHDPTQAEINALPDGSFVAVYSATDAPYVPSYTTTTNTNTTNTSGTTTN